MGTAAVWSLSNCKFRIGSTLISGFGPDDAFRWQYTSDLWQRTDGALGDQLYARVLGRVIQGQLRLLATQPAYTLVASLLEAQTGDQVGIVPTILLPLPFLMEDGNTGETITCKSTIFMTRPAPSRGVTLGTADFGIELPNAFTTPNVLNTLGF